MGMSKSIEYSGTVPSWGTIKDKARAADLELSIRMIDNLPAFPDEEPDEGWRELRVSSPSGMMTLKRRDSTLDLVVWGNADGNLQADWLRLADVLNSLHVTP